LSHGMKFVAEEDGASLFVGVEEILDGDPELPRILVVPLRDEVENRVAGGTVDPRLHTAVGLVPGRIVGVAWRRAIDVLLEAEFAAHRFEGGPFGVGGVVQL